MRVEARVCVLLKDVEAVRRIVPPRWAELEGVCVNVRKERVDYCAREKESAPKGGQGTFEFAAGDFEVLEVGHDLRYLGER